jgi:agmatine deiminase
MPTELPAEWAPQSGVMLTWPHERGDWAPMLADVEPVFVEIASEIGLRETVLVSCLDTAHRDRVAGLLAGAGVDPARRLLYVTPSNDTWARDHGPITVLRDGRPLLLDFVFNGWGGKFAADLDNQITPCLHAAGAFGATARETVDLVLEGGGIESDGAGTLLTTARCLLSPTRNPQLSRSDLEARLRALFGCRRILWLQHGGLEGDDTDGHIDTLARFCDERTIVYVHCDDPLDPQYDELAAMAAELAALRTAAGEPYRLVPLPMPDAVHDAEGQRLPATYANFLIINGAVLAPTYNDDADGEALAQLARCFPDREVVGIPCRPLIHQYGSLHCVTMQLPAGVLSAPA